ncbi:MAG: synthase subunit [Proteiniphilum sp.]|jgi:F-type H+-transporting ATPase subunit b|nr:synthase subunit [Proteiniphilum sp.]MDK2851771.1 F-type H+-transporting ATPase subunit b [Proteiniphilum sp.]
MSLLTPEPGLLFWMLISFGTVLFVLMKYGFPIILKMVDKRRTYIEESLLSARKAHEELATVKQTSEELLARTHQEQATILKETSLLRDQMMEKARNDARKEADKMIEEARKQIETEKEKALLSIREEAAILSLNLTEKILREKLGTKEAQLALIDRLLDEIDLAKS